MRLAGLLIPADRMLAPADCISEFRRCTVDSTFCADAPVWLVPAAASCCSLARPSVHTGSASHCGLLFNAFSIGAAEFTTPFTAA